jgi:hypothetical protein
MACGFKFSAVVLTSVVGVACYTGADSVDVFDEVAEMRKVETNSVRYNGLAWNGLTWNGVNWNGLTWNGVNWNGVNWNGINWNGVNWNGLTWNGINWNGIHWNSSRVDGSEVVVYKQDGEKITEFSGEELIGMEIVLMVDVRDEEGETTSMPFIIRVDDIYPDENWPDVYYYDMVLAPAGSDDYRPLCNDGLGNAVPAIPMQNYWDEVTGDRIDDPGVVTFACTSGVIAHCAQWGYRPWAEAKRCDTWYKDKKGKNDCQMVPLADYHQACTRMARADYCGTGEAWTVPGTPIDIYDHLFNQIESPETDWPIEAEWTPDGAYCLNDIRQQGWKAEGKYPQCNNGMAKKAWDCGSLAGHRALTASKFEKKKKKWY